MAEGEATPEATTEVAETVTQTTEVKSDSGLGEQGTKALEEERRARRDADKQLKAAMAELNKIREASLSDTEKAVKAARDEGLAEGIRVGASKIAAAEIRAAATGRLVDVDALLEGVDTSRFIGEDGEVDRVAVVGWVDKVAPPPPEPAPESSTHYLDLGQGPRSGASTPPALNSPQLEKDLRAALRMT